MKSRFLAAILAIASILGSQISAQETGALSLRLPVYRTKGSGSALKYQPFKAKSGMFEVTVELFDGADFGSPVFSQELAYIVRSPEAPNPSVSLLTTLSAVDGVVDVLLGSDPDNALPPDLLALDLWYSTRVSIVKKDDSLISFASTPLQPLGLSGITLGQDLVPHSVTVQEGVVTPELVLTSNATAGYVLTSDAQGRASWQPVAVSPDAITSVQIVDASIETVDLADASVDSSKILDGSIAEADLGDGSVTSTKIEDGAIGSAALANGAVGNSQIATNAVTADKIAGAAITSAKIVDGTITSVDLAASSVGTTQLANGAVTAAKIASNAITSAQLASGSVQEDELASGAVTGSKIKSGVVDFGHLATDSVRSAAVDDGSLLGADVSTKSGQVYHLEQSGLLQFVGSAFQHVLLGDHGAGDATNTALRITTLSTPSDFRLLQMESFGNTRFSFLADGNAYADKTWNSGGADYADLMHVPEGASGLEPGVVLVVDPNHPRAVAMSREARSHLVAGIYSTNPSVLGWGDTPNELPDPDAGALLAAGLKAPNVQLGREDVLRLFDQVPLALVGVAPCKVSAENGPIRPGDLLVTAWTPGHAMRDEVPAAGTIVGKALGTLDVGTGVIDVLVTLQ